MEITWILEKNEYGKNMNTGKKHEYEGKGGGTWIPKKNNEQKKNINTRENWISRKHQYWKKKLNTGENWITGKNLNTGT